MHGFVQAYILSTYTNANTHRLAGARTRTQAHKHTHLPAYSPTYRTVHACVRVHVHADNYVCHKSRYLPFLPTVPTYRSYVTFLPTAPTYRSYLPFLPNVPTMATMQSPLLSR